MPRCHAEGRGFESHHPLSKPPEIGGFLIPVAKRLRLGLVASCPSCGKDLPGGEFSFCPFCAAPLQAAMDAPREQRKTVTVLFCDVTGSLFEALAQVGEQGFRSTVGFLLAEALCRQGDAEAEQIAIEAAAMTSVDDFVTHAGSLAVRAVIEARRGDTELAERLAREAVGITAETDYFAEQARALVALADVLEMAGRQDDVAATLALAAAAYDRKGATAGVDAVRRRLA